jgi:hypothetical protein
MMKARNSVTISNFDRISTEFITLHRGESGHDEISTGTCGSCWSEAGDFGEICSYSWNEEKNGWDFNASCMTCGAGWSDFIPYKE